jgi:hypothetical protein
VFASARNERRWTLEVQNGDYDVRTVSGDPSYPQGPHLVRAGGVSLIPEVETAQGQFLDETVRVPVRNGRLEVSVGGGAGNSLVNLIEATAVEQPPFLRSVNFQDEYSDPPPGWEVDAAYWYDEQVGYGWWWDDEEAWVDVWDTEESVPQVLDTYAYTTGPAYWEMAVPPGFYDVWLAVGDAADPEGPHRVVLEGLPVVLDEPTAAGQFLERHVGAYVDDGYLSLEVGNGQDYTTLNYVVVAAASEDADGDGWSNEEDACPFASDPDQEDSDEDGYGDACDPDRDDDGAENPADVCPDQYDPDQTDSDGDRIGDACDTCPFDRYNDQDGDGACGLSDNCPDVANSEQDDEDGDGLGDACDELRINFGPPGSEIPEGFRLSDGSSFSPLLRMGWSAGMAARERYSLFPQELDTFVFTTFERTWRAEWPNGDYLVHLSVGDASYPQGPHRVVVQGTEAYPEAPTTEAGEFLDSWTPVSVRNGRLDVAVGQPEFMEGIPPGNTTIDYVEAIPSEPQPPLASWNFQPADALPALGFLVDSGEVFDEGRGWGWSSPPGLRDRNRSVPQTLDTFAFTRPAKRWEAAVAPGFYEVWLTVGDASYPQGPQSVVVEGATVVDGEFTEAGQFLERSVQVFVGDGRLTIEIGNGDGNTCLSYVVVGPGAGPD